MARRAEQVAEGTYDGDITEKKNRNHIRDALKSDGVSGSVDDLVRDMFPNHK